MDIFKMPLHPALVHFPIAFYFLELFLLFLWVFKNDDHYRRFALLTFALAFLGMLAAIAAGWKDSGGWEHITKHEELHEHFLGAVSVFCVYTFQALYWKLAKPESKAYRWILLISSVIGCVLVVVTAFHGGEMVYGG